MNKKMVHESLYIEDGYHLEDKPDLFEHMNP